MIPIRLTYPVETLDKRCLVRAGTLIDSDFMRDYSRSRPKPAAARCSLLSHRRIKRDLAAYCQEAPYNTLLSMARKSGDTESLMKESRVFPAQLDFLDYFEKQDPYTYRHSLIVFALSLEIARIIGGARHARRMSRMGPTHDFGKLCVPPSILTKPTPLTLAERSLMEHHALAGYFLMTHFQGAESPAAAGIARDHHERRDGSGYPARRKRLSAETWIVTVADIYDALISRRPYRKSVYDNRSALEELTAMADNGKVPVSLVQVLVAMNRKDGPNYRKCSLSRERRGKPPDVNFHGILARGEVA
jgi:HD-GYP domain-containing protein (c-di-GMP phosphodiesterase class II)